jgi:ABC-2 type transport system permease protein
VTRTVAVGLHRGIAEVRAFARNGGALSISIVMPVALMLLFGTLFKGDVHGTHVPFRLVVATGVLASVGVQCGFASLAGIVAAEREDGTMKRLMGMPFSLTSYFIAKTFLLVTLALVQVALGLLVAVLVLHLPLPTQPGRWLTFAWVLGLGLLASAMLGIIVGSIIPGARMASTFTSLPFVLLQFVSGVFYTFTALPRGLQIAGDLFPLKWMVQGMHSVFLPDEMLRAEPSHSWQHPQIALVLGAWAVGGLLLSGLLFRWRGGSKRPSRGTAKVSAAAPEPA